MFGVTEPLWCKSQNVLDLLTFGPAALVVVYGVDLLFTTTRGVVICVI